MINNTTNQWGPLGQNGTSNPSQTDLNQQQVIRTNGIIQESTWPLLDSNRYPKGNYINDIQEISNMEGYIMIQWSEGYTQKTEVHKDEHGLFEMWESKDKDDRELALAWASTYVGKALKFNSVTSYEFHTIDFGSGTGNLQASPSLSTQTIQTPIISNSDTSTNSF